MRKEVKKGDNIVIRCKDDWSSVREM
jgi:hypothetical protein